MSTEKENLEDFQGLARKYRITTDKIEYILKKYGSIDEYIIRTMHGEEKPEICSDGDALRENLSNFILINTSENKNWVATRIVQMCYWGMSGKGILTYDGEEVMQAFEKMSSREKKILAMFCDLHGTKYFPDKIRYVTGAMEVSEFIKITKNRKPDYDLGAYKPLGGEPSVESQLTGMRLSFCIKKILFSKS